MNEKIDQFATQTNAAYADIRAAVLNIVSDEAGQAQTIQDLKDAIANNPSDTLSPESQAALDGVLANALSIRDSLKAVADAIPDAPPPVV